jgi:hypothetical protein
MKRRTGTGKRGRHSRTKKIKSYGSKRGGIRL